MLEVRNTKKYGRGVFATRDIKAGEIVEKSPVLIFDIWDSNRLAATALNCYAFNWNDESVAIAFGFGSLLNHSKRENITYDPNLEDKTIDFIALRDIKKGHQLFINYGYTIESAIIETKANREKIIENEKMDITT